MATNFVQPGNNLSIPAPVGVTSGNPVIAGAVVGIALNTALAGETVDVATVGVWRMPKVAADAVALGAVVYWNPTTKLATITATGATKLGVAVTAAAAGDAQVNVRLSGF